MDERDINYISIPRSEWTDDTAWIAIKIVEMKTEKNPGKKIRANSVKKRNNNNSYNRNYIFMLYYGGKKNVKRSI